MKSKLMLIGVALLLFASKDLSAATVYSSSGEEVVDNSNVCANDLYYYQTDSNGMYEADIVLADNRMLVATSNSSNGEIEFLFPSNAGDLAVYIYEYNDSERELVDTIKFSVSDCGYEVISDDYKSTNMKTTFEKTDNGYQFTKPDIENYNLYINQLEPKDDGTSKKIKFKNGVANIDITTDIIQITESYVDSKGKEIEQYFEIDLRDETMIREISGIQLKVIEPMQYIDRKLLIRGILGLIVLVMLYLINVVLVKQYKAKKEYKRKYELYKKKLRAQALKKKQEEELRQKRKQEIIRQKNLRAKEEQILRLENRG